VTVSVHGVSMHAALLAGLGPEKMLPLGAIVAAGSCRALGARTGVPGRLDTKVAAFL
jgi:hypothetical protein